MLKMCVFCVYERKIVSSLMKKEQKTEMRIELTFTTHDFLCFNISFHALYVYVCLYVCKAAKETECY